MDSEAAQGSDAQPFIDGDGCKSGGAERERLERLERELGLS